eukprot:1142409-Pelagomonas_calceolata.AAC.9
MEAVCNAKAFQTKKGAGNCGCFSFNESTFCIHNYVLEGKSSNIRDEQCLRDSRTQSVCGACSAPILRCTTSTSAQFVLVPLQRLLIRSAGPPPAQADKMEIPKTSDMNM